MNSIDSETHGTVWRHVRHWIRGNLIGEGSYGKVNLAINIDNGELFAVKSIECTDRAKGELLALENELNILQSLNSPCIVRCLGSDHSLENGVPMRNLFMEYMAGGSLADLMKKFGGHLEEPLIRLYTRGIVQGLHYLHSQGIVHCDIKGKNILIGSSRVKIADFGSAKRIGIDHSSVRGDVLRDIKERGTESASMKGTPLWMAPEVVQQEEQGPASDIWSLGCTIVEMATGKPPWSNSANAFMALYRIGFSKELPSLPHGLSAESEDFLEKCFQRDPKARWTSSQLLMHPFLNGRAKEEFAAPSYEMPQSPTSILDFPVDSGWDVRDADLESVSPLPLQKRSSKPDQVPTKCCEKKLGDGNAKKFQDIDPIEKEQFDSTEEGNRRHIAICLQTPIGHISRTCLPMPFMQGATALVPIREDGLEECQNSRIGPSLCPSECPWITVRSGTGYSESRHMPLSDFMLQSASAVARAGEGNAGPIYVRKGCEVNLDCLAFLRNKRRKRQGHTEFPVSGEGKTLQSNAISARGEEREDCTAAVPMVRFAAIGVCEEKEEEEEEEEVVQTICPSDHFNGEGRSLSISMNTSDGIKNSAQTAAGKGIGNYTHLAAMEEGPVSNIIFPIALMFGGQAMWQPA